MNHQKAADDLSMALTQQGKQNSCNVSNRVADYPNLRLFISYEKRPCWQWGQVGWMLADHRDGLSSTSFLAWSSIAQSVCQRAFSLFAIWCLGSRVQILLSAAAEEHNLSPFDLNIACLSQSIEINNKHVYRHGQVRMPNGCGVERAECALIIGMGCRVQVLARFQWREAYVLDNWQLAELPQSGGREFDPHRVHDNLSVPLSVYMRFPVPEHQN